MSPSFVDCAPAAAPLGRCFERAVGSRRSCVARLASATAAIAAFVTANGVSGAAFAQEPAPPPEPAPMLLPPGPPPVWGAPPPGYALPPPMIAPFPPGVPPSAFGPKTLEYEPGAPIPPGYRVEKKIRKGLVIGGAATFGGLWLLSIVAGATLQASEEFGTSVGCGIAGALSSSPEYCEPQNDYRPMYIPLVGPFVAMGTAETDGAGKLALGVLGIGQNVGLGLLIAGVVARKETLVRYDVGGVELTIASTVAPGRAGFGLVGAM